jgi:hypothetical protein
MGLKELLHAQRVKEQNEGPLLRPFLFSDVFCDFQPAGQAVIEGVNTKRNG